MKHIVIAAAIAAYSTVASAGEVFHVSALEELKAAFGDASGGDTISLAPGEYGRLKLSAEATSDIELDYSAPVKITSAKLTNRASLSGLDLSGVHNLILEEINFDFTADDASTLRTRAFLIRDSSRVTIRSSVFVGDVVPAFASINGGAVIGKGLSVNGSSNIVVRQNTFLDWHRAMVFSGVENVIIANNDIYAIQSDGINVVAGDGVVIEGNFLHDFDRGVSSDDHSDMIQFWTAGTDVPSEDVVIRNNVLDVGDGDATQSIFMRNEVVDRGLAGDEMFYANVLIEDNVIRNNHAHGITVGESDGLVIRRNTVLDGDVVNDASVGTPKISVAGSSKDVKIKGNVTSTIPADANRADWWVSENVIVQSVDPTRPDYFEDHFITSSMSGSAKDFIVSPDSDIARLKAGARRHRLDAAPAELRPAFKVAKATGGAQTILFDATHTYAPSGAVTEEDAVFLWDMGDGAEATGQTVRHNYAEPGSYEVTLTVTQDDGTTARAETQVSVAGTDLITYSSKAGAFLSDDFGTSEVVAESDDGSVVNDSGQSIDLGGDGTAVGIDKSHILRLFGASSFSMAMTLRADTPKSVGEIMRIHGNLILRVSEGGGIDLRLWTERGEVKLQTTGVIVNDGSEHDVRIIYDNSPGLLQIYVNGTLVGQTKATGLVRGDYPRNLVFGNPWGKENFDGTLTAFDLNVADNYKLRPMTGVGGMKKDFEKNIESVVDAPQMVSSRLEGVREYKSDVRSKLIGNREGEAPPYRAFSEHVDDASLEDMMFLRGAYVLQPEKGREKVVLEGDGAYVALGRLERLESTTALTVSLTFQRDDPITHTERVIWKHNMFGVALAKNKIKIHVGARQRPFYESFDVPYVGVGDTEVHRLKVSVDAAENRLEVILDGRVVLDDLNLADLVLEPSSQDKKVWMLGTPWNRYFDGSIWDVVIDDDANFSGPHKPEYIRENRE